MYLALLRENSPPWLPETGISQTDQTVVFVQVRYTDTNLALRATDLLLIITSRFDTLEVIVSREVSRGQVACLNKPHVHKIANQISSKFIISMQQRFYWLFLSREYSYLLICGQSGNLKRTVQALATASDKLYPATEAVRD